MRPLVRGLLAFTATTALLLIASPARAVDNRAADNDGLVATLRVTDSLHPSMTLTNTGSKACKVPTGPLGTVVLTRVEQDGKPIAAIGADASLDMQEILTSQLKSLDPGASIEVPLKVLDWGPTGHAIQTVAWSPAAGAYASFYPITEKPLTIKGAYADPVLTAPDLCHPSAEHVNAPATGSTTPAAGKTSWLLIGGVGAAVLLALIAVAVVLILTRKGRRKDAGTAAMVILVLAASALGALGKAQPAHATFNPSSGLKSAFDACLNILSQPGNDPEGILPTLQAGGVQVDIQPGTANQDDYGNGEYGISKTHMLITWNINDFHQYAGTGGTADPCDSLYHEMYHAYEHAKGTYSYDQCVTNEDGATGVSVAEVRATKAQNKLRVHKGGPARSHYGDKKMPTGECLPPPDPGTCHDPERDKKIYKAFVPGLPRRTTAEVRAEGGRDGCGDSNGDPHLRTFDGLRYDFQAAGEFVLARDPAGGYEIQVRQEPVAGSRAVAVNTAIAMTVGSDRVEVRMVSGAVELLVGGVGVPLQKQTLPGGGRIGVTATHQVLIGWPDTSVATVSPIGPWGLRVAPEPAAAHDGKLEGLLGDLNGDRANDLRLRGSGTALTPTFEALYPAFADSWRVSAETSLFTYAPGFTTDSYVDRTFPEKPPALDQLSNRAAAEALCRRFGVTDPEVLVACVLDVALTGQPDFAAIAAEGQFFAAGGEFTGQRWSVRITKPGEIANLEFDGTAGQRVFVDAGGTVPDACGILALTDPAHRTIAGGCIINGRGFIDGVKLESSGKYTITVDPPGTDVGEVRLTLITFQDQSGAFAGTDATAHITQPGMVAKFTFTGAAGQKVFVDVPTSTLPDLCGVLTLVNPAGQVLAGGCVITGKGYIDAFTLETSGTYSVVVDPAAWATGDATIKLSYATDTHTTAEINGSAADVTVAQAGAIGTIAFTGQAGQQIAVDGTGSTLPDQCGVLVLRGPDGQALTSGCVISGTAQIRTFALPSSGTYTLVVDPAEHATGSVSLRIHT